MDLTKNKWLKFKLPYRIVSVFKTIALLLGFYFSIRIIYYLFHVQSLSYSQDLLHAFASGLRFDLTAIVLMNFPFFMLFAIFSAKHFSSIFAKSIEILFLVFNSFFIGVNITDIELIHFIGRRMSFDFFKIQSDIAREIPSVITDFWYMFALQIVFIALFIYLYFRWIVRPRQAKMNDKLSSHNYIISYALSYFVFLILLVLMARGGLQLKPLKPEHAFVYQNSQYGHLALNSTFTIIKSHKKNSLKKLNFYPDNLVHQTLNIKPTKLDHDLKIKNVVVIILESFAKEYTGLGHLDEGYTPFLNYLAKKSLSFELGFSNGLRSIEAMPSILCGIPTLVDESIVTSQYQANDIHCMPQVLKDHGFYTSFYHGAENGTMFFDSFSKRVGIDEYFGLNEYTGPSSDFDGVWGIYDRPYLQYVADKLSKQSQPFFSTVFTLSSHHPYNIPDKEKPNFPTGELKIHQSVAYADDALKDFFHKISKQQWFDETLFIITADHTQKSSRASYQNFFGSYRVPILFYSPNYDLNQWPHSKVAQHVDIYPTVLDVLDMPYKLTSMFGRSIYSQPTKHYVVNKDGSSFWLFNGEQVIKYNPVNNNQLTYKFEKGQLESIKAQNFDAWSEVLKAYIQYHHNSMVENRIYNFAGDLTSSKSADKELTN